MSLTLDTTTMCNILAKRVPIGLANPGSGAVGCIGLLNQAYRWIEQQGAFEWNIKYENLGINVTCIVDMPQDFDIGKPSVMYHFPSPPSQPYEIPYMPLDEAIRQQGFQNTVTNRFSVWSFYPKPSSTIYQAIFYPLSIAPQSTVTVAHFYHKLTSTPLIAGGATYFPTPDCFDDLIIDLAEAEAKRNAYMAGWEWIQKKAENEATKLLEQYRSNRKKMAGLAEAAKRAQETQFVKGA